MVSINQNAYSSALPNFRNLGILLRILLIVNFIAIAAAAVKSGTLRSLWHELLDVSTVVQPLLLLSVLTLIALNDLLKRLPYYLGAVVVIALELGLTALLHVFGRSLLGAELGSLERYWLLTLIVAMTLLFYFDLRGRALSPALAEARLQALQARIRPHFLFNSINAVLSLIRQEPRRAERALEDMADLFRVLMADNRDLALRLGERLRVEWHIDKMPGDAFVPPLVLQPLLENAVYHGIEPRTEPGVISIDIYLAREQVHAVLRNPYQHDGSHHAGNKMALANIRERLQLHFDAEASLATKVGDNAYQVHIIMPYVKARQ
jgi:two-component system sensor histidine kinase AlgZ